jgi:hypothetical protein
MVAGRLAASAGRFHELIPNATTKSSTARVDTPATSASITTAYSARSMRRRDSRIDGRKLRWATWDAQLETPLVRAGLVIKSTRCDGLIHEYRNAV